MVEECVEGIILYVTPFKESSEILQVLTKEHGLIGLLCRGSKKVKSKFLNKTRIYNYAKFFINYKIEGLSLVKEIDVVDYFTYFHQDITLITYLSYLGNLTYQVTKQDKTAEILPLLMTVLKKISAGLDALVLTNILEIKYLKYLGINLNLNNCIKCGNCKNIKTLNGTFGGLICSNCYQNEYIVSPKTIMTIRNYAKIDITKIKEIKISPLVKTEINLFLSNYYEAFTGLYVKNKELLNKLAM